MNHQVEVNMAWTRTTLIPLASPVPPNCAMELWDTNNSWEGAGLSWWQGAGLGWANGLQPW